MIDLAIITVVLTTSSLTLNPNASNVMVLVLPAVEPRPLPVSLVLQHKFLKLTTLVQQLAESATNT